MTITFIPKELKIKFSCVINACLNKNRLAQVYVLAIMLFMAKLDQCGTLTSAENLIKND